MNVPLEDSAADVIGKAQRGLAISDSELAQRAGVSVEAVRQSRSGGVDAESLRKIAPVLELDAQSLIDLANGD
jgi:transcriptional regulator with XRE-family HTH domain